MRYGDLPGDHFFLGLEQLEVCRELLLSGSAAKARMAVILLDGLADAILYRRLQDLYLASEHPTTRRKMRQYPKKLRGEARRNFGRRVELTQETTYLDEFRGDSAIVDELDAAILRVGHSYRNDAYHRDTHNPSVIDLVGKVMFAAVARVFARAQSPSWGLSEPEPRREMLERLGVDEETPMLTYRVAAEQATAALGAELGVGVESLGQALAEDLDWRASEAADLAGYLPESGAELDESLARYEIWSKHAVDEDVLELTQRSDPEHRARSEGLDHVPEGYLTDAHEAAKAFFARMRELERTEKPTVSLALIDQAREVAERLTAERDLAIVMKSYHDIDRKLSVLEDYLGEAVSAYDDEINRQIDIARGR
jgi:hypothetical protein